MLLALGCTHDVVYQGNAPISTEGWSSSYVPEFSFEIADTVNRHDVYIDVRHTGDYAFSNLFLFVDMAGPGGRNVRDTVECLLADPTGRWLGKGTGFIFSDRKQAKVLFKLRNRFPAIGRYTVELQQAMRADPLPGVIDVGVSVERSPGQ